MPTGSQQLSLSLQGSSILKHQSYTLIKYYVSNRVGSRGIEYLTWLRRRDTIVRLCKGRPSLAAEEEHSFSTNTSTSGSSLFFSFFKVTSRFAWSQVVVLGCLHHVEADDLAFLLLPGVSCMDTSGIQARVKSLHL